MNGANANLLPRQIDQANSGVFICGIDRRALRIILVVTFSAHITDNLHAAFRHGRLYINIETIVGARCNSE